MVECCQTNMVYFKKVTRQKLKTFIKNNFPTWKLEHDGTPYVEGYEVSSAKEPVYLYWHHGDKPRLELQIHLRLRLIKNKLKSLLRIECDIIKSKEPDSDKTRLELRNFYYLENIPKEEYSYLN